MRSHTSSSWASFSSLKSVRLSSTLSCSLFPLLVGSLSCDSRAVVAAVSVTVAADNLKTIKNSLTDKTEGLKTLSELMDTYSLVAAGILLATAVSQFICMLTMWWYDETARAASPRVFISVRRYKKLISDQAPPAPPPAPPAVDAGAACTATSYLFDHNV